MSEEHDGCVSADEYNLACEQRSKYRARVERMEKALREVAEKEGMTMLSHCCVDKVCQPVYDEDGKQEAACSYQLGVNRGYGECARIALASLTPEKAKSEGEV